MYYYYNSLANNNIGTLCIAVTACFHFHFRNIQYELIIIITNGQTEFENKYNKNQLTKINETI